MSGDLDGGADGPNDCRFNHGTLLGGEGLPFIVLFGLERIVLGNEQVLEVQTGKLTDGEVLPLGGKLVGEGNKKVGQVVLLRRSEGCLSLRSDGRIGALT